MITLFLALSFADVTATAVADRDDVRLSDSVHLTLTAEGPAPLAVTVPDEWLTIESSANWRTRPVGVVTVTPLPNGRERWVLTLRLDPYATGDPLALTLNAVSVRSGGDATPQIITWSIPPLRVTSRAKEPSAEDVRPITGIETVPTAVRSSAWGWIVAVVTALSAMAAIVYRLRSRPARGHDGVSEKAIVFRAIESQTDPREIARLVARAVRHSLGPYYDCRTTGEISRECDTRTNSSSVAEGSTLLELCDRVHFDPAAANESDDLKARALAWLRSC